MPASATQQKVGENGCVGNLILPAQQEAPSFGRFQRLVAVHLLVIFSSCIGMRDWDARPAIAKNARRSRIIHGHGVCLLCAYNESTS